MSFFDLVENTADQAAEQPLDRARITAETTDESETAAARKPERQQKASRRSKSRPERLKFLKPCPLCGGKKFTHGSTGGFFCDTCQPGIPGVPVIALGHREAVETVEGLACPGCGSTTYQRIENGFIFDDGTMADGWYCGGKNCHIKLLIGNKKTDQASRPQPKAKEPTPNLCGGQGSAARSAEQKKYFQAAFPWLMAHLTELQAVGWTRPELFRRGKCRWPSGNWGLAWLPVWVKHELKVDFNEKTGAIRFIFTDIHGKKITQTAYPKMQRK